MSEIPLNRWYVRSGRDSVRLYRLPARCPRCKSRDIYAEEEGGFVKERCPECDHNRDIRIHGSLSVTA